MTDQLQLLTDELSPRPSARYSGFDAYPLGANDLNFYVGRLPSTLEVDDTLFEALWSLHPEKYHTISIHGRDVKTPRWQQAYGADYYYTGRVNRALPLTDAMRPFLDFAHEVIDPRLNGVLFNWYDGDRKHYIGKHRDSTRSMIEGCPIVTISLGQERVFRLRPYKGEGFTDFTAHHGAVFILPYAVNEAYTHEVPHFARFTKRRISITLRGFDAA